MTFSNFIPMQVKLVRYKLRRVDSKLKDVYTRDWMSDGNKLLIARSMVTWLEMALEDLKYFIEKEQERLGAKE